CFHSLQLYLQKGPFSYQWEKSTNGGTSWTSISGATGQDYSFYSLTSATLFRRIVSSGNAIPNTSASVLITIYPPISNNNINGNQTLICGNTYFDPNPLIGNLPSGGNNTFSYYWEYSYNQSTWITIANSNSMSYDPPVISNNNSYQNIYYRRVVKSGSYTSFSNSILVQFQFPDPIQNNSILFQTNDPKVQQGGNHYVSCTSSADPNIIIGSTPTGAGAAIFSYQWMYSIDGGITLLNYAGATSKDFDPPIISQYTLIYRKVMTNNCNIPSVSLPVAVYTQLTQNTICCNNNISCSFDPPILTGNSFNSSPTLFQWQSSIDGMNWNPISGATSANYDPSKISTSMHFRRMATSHASCSFVPSNISTQTLLHPMIEFQETSNPLSLSDVSNADFMLPLDFNRDSYSDIFLSNKMSGNNTIYLNQGNGTFAATNNIINSLSLNENPDNAIVGDFNGDQSEDLFYHWKNTGNNRIFLSNAPATANFNIINNPINATNINENPDYVIVGNFNNDNYSDLFFFWRSTGINRLFINNKNNTFSTYSNPIASSAVNEFSDYLVSGDFNGDSKTDLYFFWKASGTNRLFTTTNTTGIFSYASNPISNAAINENPDYVITGDFGSDTKTDLFIGWKSTGKNLLFLSNGTSFAQTNYPIKATSINENPDYIIPTRLTNSGKNDLLFFWRNTGINKIMTSNGTSFNQCYNYLSICSVNEYPDKILSGKFSSNPYSSLLFTWKSIGRSRIYSTSTNLICNSNYRLNEIGNDLDNSKQYQSQAIAYPNPFTNEITLEFWVENPSTSIIEFYNSLGERVITHQLFSNEGVNSPKISLHNLVPGIYYYKILIDGNQKFSGTLLK
ncbi:MAG: T9SS type A sorting domain-containing protein, partial [Cytophagaceae bacterium]|nr:T9SS type A sorting domain-containing protein [Cytophagaceae bacterium]